MKILQTADDFKTFVKSIKEELPNYKDPIAFGICKINEKNNYQPSYCVVSWNENFASAAIFLKALSEQGIEVDFNKNEITYHINEIFLKSSLNAFAPFIDKAHGDSHKNIQTVSSIYKQFTKNNSLKDEYEITFIFADAQPRSVESTYLKLYAISEGKIEFKDVNLNLEI